MSSIRTPVSARWTPARLALLGGGLLAAGLIADGTLHAALAANPFGAPPGSAPEPQSGGVIGWLLTQQSAFYKQMTGTIRAAKSDGSAVWTLIGISFAYGVFHAAGPGHGKAVISSYLVANEESARRGIVLSLVSSLLQALVAVTIVGVGAWLLNVTAKTMCSAERAIEIASYALIALFGAGLVWNKGGSLLRALRSRAASAEPAHSHHHDHHAAHHHHGANEPCPSCAAAHGAHAPRRISTTMMRPRRASPPSTTMAITTIAIMTMAMTTIAAMPTGRNPANWPGRAAGAAVLVRCWRSGCGPVPGRFWCWYLRWRRGCSGPGWPRLSRWGSVPRSRWRPLRC